jgi:hypothetical protein
MQTVFYSWQTDSPNSMNRGFIGECLEKALKALRAEGSVHIDPCPDRDTLGIPGSPDIAETIFEKIDDCSAFVADVSLINGRRNTDKLGCDCTRLTPNPNVLCEWGRATRSVTFDRIISVFNLATGSIEDLPFDMRKRRVVTYRLAGGDDKPSVRDELAGKLKAALEPILKLPRTSLSLEFGDREHRTPIGTSLKVEGVCNGVPRLAEIPDYNGESSEESARWHLGESPNRNYHRELAEAFFLSRLMRPFSLVATNVGDRVLRNVRIEAVVQATEAEGVWVLEEYKMPEKPSQFENRIPRIGSVWRRRSNPDPGDSKVSKLPDRFALEVKFGDIQAKSSVFSESICCGSAEPREILLQCRIYADELHSPEEFSLTIDFATEQQPATEDDFIRFLTDHRPA